MGFVILSLCQRDVPTKVTSMWEKRKKTMATADMHKYSIPHPSATHYMQLVLYNLGRYQGSIAETPRANQHAVHRQSNTSLCAQPTRRIMCVQVGNEKRAAALKIMNTVKRQCKPGLLRIGSNVMLCKIVLV